MNELPVGVDHVASELSSASRAPAHDDHGDRADERGGDAGEEHDAGWRGREPSWPPPG